MRVAVFGGGYAGIVAATRLERRLEESSELLFVDPRPAHLVKHELHRVIRQPAMADAITIPFESILDRADVLQRKVVRLDPDLGTATFENDESLDYDAGIVSFGAAPADYGIDGVVEHSIPLSSTAEAREIRETTAELLDRGTGQIIVAGAGLAGIQTAGELAEIRSDAEAEDVSILLLEQADRIAPGAPEKLSTALSKSLLQKGVDVRTGVGVTAATAEHIMTDGEGSLPHDLLVWTGGIAGREAFDGIRPTVRADLRLGDRTFAAGDAVQVVDQEGQMVRPTAQSAVAMAPVAADNAMRRATAEATTGFGPDYRRYLDSSAGLVVTVGEDTVAQVGPSILTGTTARALKSFIGARYLSSAGQIEAGVKLARTEFGLAPPKEEQ